MHVATLVVSMFATNCYLVSCPETGEGIVIDPGAEGKRILHEIKKRGLKIVALVNTHGHIDHTGANGRLKEALRVPLYFPEKDLDCYLNPGFGLGVLFGKPVPPDVLLKEGDKISFGRVSLVVLETPGHTAGGISLYGSGAVFTGDALFAGSIGRTDLAGGSYELLMESITGKLMTLPPQTLVYPGHGPATTIEEEARSNPFLLAP
ncbi:MAG: MBL fold metallo-hydrolase [Firmicutes bacterium]|nr:MBL fold metallo-hydrolase [Bacillota bacterium]